MSAPSKLIRRLVNTHRQFFVDNWDIGLYLTRLNHKLTAENAKKAQRPPSYFLSLCPLCLMFRTWRLDFSSKKTKN